MRPTPTGTSPAGIADCIITASTSESVFLGKKKIQFEIWARRIPAWLKMDTKRLRTHPPLVV